MSKKSILMINQNFYPEIGSAANRMKNIYELLAETYEVDVLTTEASYPNKSLYADQDFWEDAQLNEDSHITRVQVKNRKYSRNMFNRLLYYLEMMFRMCWFILFSKKQYDIVFVTSPPIFLGIVGVIAKYRYRAKMILDVRDLWPDSLKGVGVFDSKIIIAVFKVIEKFLYNHATSIIINSKGFKEPIEKQLHKRTPIYFMPNSIRQAELVVEKEKAEEFSVIYSGNIGLAQDIEFLKELSKALYEERIRLNVIGFGLKRNELQQFVKENGLKNVHFLKAVTRKKCFRLLKQNHIGVVCLKDEEVFNTVLPGKLIDYLACGLPIVAGASGYAKAVIEQQNVGHVSDTRNIQEIVQYIAQLKQHQNLLQPIAQQGRKLIDQNFIWEKNIAVLIAAIEGETDIQKVHRLATSREQELVKINSKVN